MNLTSFSYGPDAVGNRATATQSGAACADYGSNPVVYTYTYDSVGQLQSALGSLNSAPMAGRQYEYAYDSAGNRLTVGHNGVNGAQEQYWPNPLNQITAKENNAVPVQGTANASASVEVTSDGINTAASRAGNYWGAEAMLANSGGPASSPISIAGALVGGGPGGTDLVTSTTVNAFLPTGHEAMTYDSDGNLTADGVWNYTWNAENELIKMINVPAQEAGVAAMEIVFTYDYLGRRVEKQVLAWTGEAWQSQSDRRFVYDGWNVIAELDGANSEAVVRHFIWGLDLSGSARTMGGIGGLLMIQDNGHTYFPAYDGGGNVVALMDAANNGSLAATYEYTPFGQLLRKEGSYAGSNPFRFSTKWWDEETGQVYYGARYYSPRLGRFLNQDPVGEKGGINLYGFCGNDPVDRFDVNGNSWLSKLWDHTVLSASQHIGQYVSSLQRWANAHPLVFLDGFSHLTDSHLVWRAAQREPQIAAVVAAIATW